MLVVSCSRPNGRNSDSVFWGTDRFLDSPTEQRVTGQDSDPRNPMDDDTDDEELLYS